MTIIKRLLAAGAMACALVAAPAQAVFIVGSITVSDGIDLATLPPVPSASVVSALPGIDHDPAGLHATSGCSGTFTTEATCGLLATMTDWLFGGPFPIIISVDGFTFDVDGVSLISPAPLVCPPGGGTCTDGLVVFLFGTVSHASYDTTDFTGSLTLSGSCIGSGASCTSSPTAGYTYSLSATGGRRVPEPETAALIGLGLLILGLMRRRRI